MLPLIRFMKLVTDPVYVRLFVKWSEHEESKMKPIPLNLLVNESKLSFDFASRLIDVSWSP
jgi:hypothetical protein